MLNSTCESVGGEGEDWIFGARPQNVLRPDLKYRGALES